MHEHSDQKTVSGVVTDVFAHRFVVRTANATLLADLGPKGAEAVRLRPGDEVTLVGEMKPSELKVSRIAIAGGRPTDIEHKKKPEPGADEPHADPAAATQAVRDAGFSVVGEPKRRPKHFEILGRRTGSGFVELHVEFDGALRKTRVVNHDDHKWAVEMNSAAP